MPNKVKLRVYILLTRMMVKRSSEMLKCIYCNETKDLNTSHIVPEGLTNSQITRKNVCQTHNSDFGNSFESDVMESFLFLRNHLDIKGKNKKYAEYKTAPKINGVEYKPRKITNDLNLFNGKPIKSSDGKYLFGDFETLKKIAEKKGGEVEPIDLNNSEILLNTGFSLEVFFSLSMRRLMAKIAYEWLCSLNDINERYEDFSGIIDFITTGNGDNYVKYISDINVYKAFSELCNSGSHSLLAYQDKQNDMIVLINFFGVCIFKVNFKENIPPKIINKFGFHELQISTKKVKFKDNDFRGFTDHIHNNVLYIVNQRISFRYPLLPQQEIEYGFGIIKIMNYVENISDKSTVNEELIQLILKNYKELIHTSIVHIRKLKRFVSEQVIDLKVVEQLNLKRASYDVFFLYYILYLIGRSGEIPSNPNSISTLISNNIGENESVDLNSNLINDLMKVLFMDESYFDHILKGAILVKEAPYQ